MSKLDNQTYRDTYHFKRNGYFNNYGGPSSLRPEPDINATIGQNDERSNVEVEKGELILQPDLSGLHKARGKKHSQGGVNVNLKPDTFIFSDDPMLHFTEKEKELFEFKKGGSTAKTKNTPAQVLKRNVDPKHYNTLINNITDVKKDPLTKKSSSLMLEKYLETLGNVAYLQEAKKDFPDGLPAFSNGTAPVYEADTKEDIMSQKQYAKYGGPVLQAGGRVPKTITYRKRDGSTQVIDLSKKKDGMYSGTFNGKPGTFDQNAVDYLLSGYKGGDNFVVDENILPESSHQGFIGTGIPKQANPFLPPAQRIQLPANTIEEHWGDNLQPIENTGRISTSTPARRNPYTGGHQNPGVMSRGHVGPNWGLWEGDKLSTFKDKYKVTNAADKIDNLSALAAKLGYTGPRDNKSFQEWLYNFSPENKAVIDKWHNQYKGTGPKDGMFDGKIGIRWQNAIQELANSRPLPTPIDIKPKPFTAPAVTPAGPTVITPNGVDGPPQGDKTIDTTFTPEQRIAQGYANFKYANAKRYMPYRSHLNPSYVDPQLVNPEQAVGDVRGQANSQIAALNSLNPILRNAQAQAFSGQVLNQLPGIRAQYDNQNAQITNQFRGMNNQIRNNASAQNMQNDQMYYQQQVAGRQNYDDLKTFLADQAMNTRTQHVQENEQLAWNLLTQQNPVYGFDFRRGRMTRNPNVNIMDIPTDTRSGIVENILQGIDMNSLNDKDKISLLGQLTKRDALKYINPQYRKKGGRVNPYRK